MLSSTDNNSDFCSVIPDMLEVFRSPDRTLMRKTFHATMPSVETQTRRHSSNAPDGNHREWPVQRFSHTKANSCSSPFTFHLALLDLAWQHVCSENNNHRRFHLAPFTNSRATSYDGEQWWSVASSNHRGRPAGGGGGGG